MNNADDPGSICSQSTTTLTIAGIGVDVVRKSIEAIDLNVVPPHGRVRAAVPFDLDDDAVRRAVEQRLDWIRRQQAAYASSGADPQQLWVSGEQAWFLGRRYRLAVIERAGNPGVRLHDEDQMTLSVAPGSGDEQRAALVDAWYRAELERRVPPLLAHWQPFVGRTVAAWEVKAMQTRWGICQPGSRRIALNPGLVRKSPRCLEYILVHELVHLRERRHGERFDAWMTRLLPDWPQRRDELDRPPLSRPGWGY